MTTDLPPNVPKIIKIRGVILGDDAIIQCAMRGHDPAEIHIPLVELLELHKHILEHINLVARQRTQKTLVRFQRLISVIHGLAELYRAAYRLDRFLRVLSDEELGIRLADIWSNLIVHGDDGKHGNRTPAARPTAMVSCISL
jgi:hypothetical protein